MNLLTQSFIFNLLVAIGGVYSIVEWQMEPWMALLWGVGQVLSRHLLLIFHLFLDCMPVDCVNVPPTLHAVILMISKLLFSL